MVPTSIDAEALSKLQVKPGQEEEWKKLKQGWVNGKKAATKEHNKHVIAMNMPGYHRDTTGSETQRQMRRKLNQAIEVLNTCQASLDKSVQDIIDFIGYHIPNNNDEEESMHDFTILRLWEAHTEYKYRILLSIQEWEGLYKPVLPPQPEPAPAPVAQSAAPEIKILNLVLN